MRDIQEQEVLEVPLRPEVGQKVLWRDKIWTIVKIGLRPNGVRHIDLLTEAGEEMSAFDSLFVKRIKILNPES